MDDDVMEEILQDPTKFEELLKEREQPPVKPVKKFASPLPSSSVCAYGRASGWISQTDPGTVG